MVCLPFKLAPTFPTGLPPIHLLPVHSLHNPLQAVSRPPATFEAVSSNVALPKGCPVQAANTRCDRRCHPGRALADSPACLILLSFVPGPLTAFLTWLLTQLSFHFSLLISLHQIDKFLAFRLITFIYGKLIPSGPGTW